MCTGWNRIRVRWGVSEEVKVNRKIFAHASHPSFLPSFLPSVLPSLLPSFLPSRKWQYSNPYLGDCNAQLIPCQCGHRAIRIVSASQKWQNVSAEDRARQLSRGMHNLNPCRPSEHSRHAWTGARRGWCLRIEMGSALLGEALNSGQAIGYLRVRGDFLLVRCTSRTYCASTGSRNDDTLTRVRKLITWG